MTAPHRGYKRNREGVERGKILRRENARPRSLPELRRDAWNLATRVAWWGRRNERPEGEVFRALAMFIAQHLYETRMTREQMEEALRWRVHYFLHAQYGVLNKDDPAPTSWHRAWPCAPAPNVIDFATKRAEILARRGSERRDEA